MTEEMIKKEISSFIDEDGKLISFPAKRKKQLMALLYLAPKIPSDRVFSQPELNAFLDTLHTFSDSCLLRRELCDAGFLSRERDGSSYKANTVQPTAEDLLK